MRPSEWPSAAAGLAGALVAGLAGAQESDRSVLLLYHACQVEADRPASWCEAYLMGVADTLTAFGAGGHKAGLCVPDYELGTLARIFMAWVPKHRDFWDLDMLAGAQAAFRERWPCGPGG